MRRLATVGSIGILKTARGVWFVLTNCAIRCGSKFTANDFVLRLSKTRRLRRVFLLKKSDKIIVPEEFMVYISLKCGIY